MCMIVIFTPAKMSQSTYLTYHAEQGLCRNIWRGAGTDIEDSKWSTTKAKT